MADFLQKAGVEREDAYSTCNVRAGSVVGNRPALIRCSTMTVPGCRAKCQSLRRRCNDKCRDSCEEKARLEEESGNAQDSSDAVAECVQGCSNNDFVCFLNELSSDIVNDNYHPSSCNFLSVYTV
eukprot:GHVT01059404.1.p1 GENE.GHVT01059404.1~~GHVT01059404.1.p1  ORF type:complete len:125 (-),score=12.68 GHVT01059404.1:388-762(-)